MAIRAFLAFGAAFAHYSGLCGYINHKMGDIKEIKL